MTRDEAIDLTFELVSAVRDYEQTQNKYYLKAYEDVREKVINALSQVMDPDQCVELSDWLLRMQEMYAATSHIEPQVAGEIQRMREWEIMLRLAASSSMAIREKQS